jgi:hypothetical protein
MQVLLERGELRIARDLRGLRMLLRELMDVQERLKSNVGTRLGAEGYGEHDDLAIALALACLEGEAEARCLGRGGCRGFKAGKIENFWARMKTD